MKTTRYFEERKRPYIRREWCEQALQQPAQREVQPDGRIRHWILIPETWAVLACGDTSG